MTAPPKARVENSRAQFEALALPFMKSLYNTALRLTHHPEDASDLVQEAYLRAYRTFSNFTLGTNCKSWLFTIMYSVFVNKYRKEQREPEAVSLEEMEGKFNRCIEAKDWDSHLAISQTPNLNWKSPEVDAALNRLPETWRSSILLVDIEEMSYEEASAVLICPVGTLRSRLFRARKQLFLELQDYAQKMGYIKRSSV